MLSKKIQLSPAFRAQTTKAVSSIVIFIFVYLIIVLLAIGLTALCVYGGILLVISFPRFITIALGLGLASLGFIVLLFLFKFIFKSNKLDRSHLTEIKQKDQPQLFELVKDIVNEVGTDFPKKIYLSSDVNASVFYDSNFWSMFLPVKKNLIIGMGLVNSIHKEELRAILSHEFGHFSQRTMKVGSYVYNVNQVIFNMLYDNESYDKTIQSWANASGYFSIFMLLAVSIVRGIQWILQKMYQLVNKNYMALSREMEFHADEIAANVTGYKPLKNALLRMNLADHSFNAVLGFYESKISQNLKSKNLFKEHAFVLNFLAEEDELPIKYGLPEISVEELNKFNKSKLNIEDQWASHPSTEDRIKRLEQTNLIFEENEQQAANSVFHNLEQIQIALTENAFKEVKYEGEVEEYSFSDFKKEYQEEFNKNSFSKIFNGYYDNRNPGLVETAEYVSQNRKPTIDELFSDELVGLNYTAIALESDSQVIEQIANSVYKVKTFDYDGRKYRRKEARQLLRKLKDELQAANQKLDQNDRAIFHYFRNLEENYQKTSNLDSLYKSLSAFEKEYEERIEVYNTLSERLQFINFTTPIDQIKANFSAIKPIELRLKKNIELLMSDAKYKAEITPEIRNGLQTYLSQELKYFGNESYFDTSLEKLFTALNSYAYLLSRGYFVNKKALLDYKVTLLEGQINSTAITA